MKELFIALGAALMNAGLQIKYIDLYKRQFENLEQDKEIVHNSFDFPAVLIELKVNWTSTAQGVQSGNCTVTLHIGQELYENTDYNSPESLNALANIFDLPQAIYLTLQGLTGLKFTGLVRTDDEPDVDYGNLNVHKLTFTTTITDAVKFNTSRFIKVGADLKLGKNITPDTVYPQPAVIPGT
jgi:hypothetical protein